MQLSSSAFINQSQIPRLYTCEGRDIAPRLAWSDVPEGTRSLALVVEDPDAPDPAAPKRTWVHWLLYNLPADSRGLPEGGRPLPEGTRQGLNDWHREGYGGPCPPVGKHRYFFKLFALDVKLQELDRADRRALEHAMEGHCLAEAEMMGTYEKSTT